MKIKQDFYAIGYIDDPHGFSLVDLAESFDGGLDGCTRFQTQAEAKLAFDLWKREGSYAPNRMDHVLKVSVIIEDCPSMGDFGYPPGFVVSAGTFQKGEGPLLQLPDDERIGCPKEGFRDDMSLCVELLQLKQIIDDRVVEKGVKEVQEDREESLVKMFGPNDEKDHSKGTDFEMLDGSLLSITAGNAIVCSPSISRNPPASNQNDRFISHSAFGVSQYSGLIRQAERDSGLEI